MSTDDLHQALKEWDRLGPEQTVPLVQSMPNWLTKCLAAAAKQPLISVLSIEMMNFRSGQRSDGGKRHIGDTWLNGGSDLGILGGYNLEQTDASLAHSRITESAPSWDVLEAELVVAPDEVVWIDARSSVRFCHEEIA